MPTKDELLSQLDTISRQLIYDRSQTDVNNILALGDIAYDDMNAAQRTFITSAQKGAYNYTDRNRVANFCNTLVTLMETYYGVVTPSFSTMVTNWESITDPTENQLTTYINSVIAVRNKWYSELQIPGSPTINQIYTGISLETANNIETVLKTIHENLNAYMIGNDVRYCGQLYGPDSSSIIVCGFNIWTGADRSI